jgi:hypothetical protein
MTDEGLIRDLAARLLDVEFPLASDITPDAEGFMKVDRNQQRQRFLISDVFRKWYPKSVRDRVVALARKEGWFAPGRASDTATREVVVAGETYKVYRVRMSKVKRFGS